MAFNNLTSISIGDGDPVTADVLRKIVENINIIAKGETVTPVQIESKTNGGAIITSKGLNTTVGGIISVQLTAKGGALTKVPLKSFGFTDIPIISVAIEFTSVSASQSYTPYIMNVTQDGFNIYCKPATLSTPKATAKIHYTASGNTSSLTA
jgi:hypothetical protein